MAYSSAGMMEWLTGPQPPIKPTAAARATVANIVYIPPREIYDNRSYQRQFDREHTWIKFNIDDAIVADKSDPLQALHFAMKKAKAEHDDYITETEPVRKARVLGRLHEAYGAALVMYEAQGAADAVRAAGRNTTNRTLPAAAMRSLPARLVAPATTLMTIAERSQFIHPLIGTGRVARLFLDLEPKSAIRKVFSLGAGIDPLEFIHRNRLYESNYSRGKRLSELPRGAAIGGDDARILSEFQNVDVLASPDITPKPSTLRRPERVKPFKLFDFPMLLVLVAIGKLKKEGTTITAANLSANIDALYSSYLHGLGAGLGAAMRVETAAATATDTSGFLMHAKLIARQINLAVVNAGELPYDTIFNGQCAHISNELAQPHNFLHHAVYIGKNLVVDVWNRMFTEANSAEITRLAGASAGSGTGAGAAAPGIAAVSLTRSEATVSVRLFEEYMDTALKSASPVYFTPYTNMYDNRLLRRRAIWTIGRFPRYNVEAENCESHAEWVFDNHGGKPRFCMLTGFYEGDDLDNRYLREFYNQIFIPFRRTVDTELYDNYYDLVHNVTHGREHEMGGGARYSRSKRYARRKTHVKKRKGRKSSRKN